MSHDLQFFLQVVSRNSEPSTVSFHLNFDFDLKRFVGTTDQKVCIYIYMYTGDQRRHPSLGMARYWHESPWIIYEYVFFSLLVGHFVTDSTIVNHHLFTTIW